MNFQFLAIRALTARTEYRTAKSVRLVHTSRITVPEFVARAPIHSRKGVLIWYLLMIHFFYIQNPLISQKKDALFNRNCSFLQLWNSFSAVMITLASFSVMIFTFLLLLWICCYFKKKFCIKKIATAMSKEKVCSNKI